MISNRPTSILPLKDRYQVLLKILLPTIILIIGFGTSHAASSGIRIINTEIAHDKTSLCALRDQYGFLWVGTLTGLGCYDCNGESLYGGTSAVVPFTEGVSVNSLLENKDDIWFGSTLGLYIFNRSENKIEKFPYKTKYGVPVSSPVQKISIDGKGHVWILTRGQGLFIFDPATGSMTQNSVQGAYYSDIISGIDNNVYCMTHDGYLIAFDEDGKAEKRMRLPGFVTDKNPISMTIAEGEVIISANHALYDYAPGSNEVKVMMKDANCGIINTINGVDRENLWIGTDEGIFCLRTHYGPVPSANVNPTPVRLGNATGEPGLTDCRVVQLMKDPKGGVIVVTRTGISFVNDAVSAIRKVGTSGDRLLKNAVNVICNSRDGSNVWVGTDHGVTSYNIPSGTVTDSKLPLGTDIVVTSLVEYNDKLWIGSNHQGLFSYNTNSGQVRNYTYDESKPYAVLSNSINDLCLSKTGELFILTNWGLCKYNPEEDNFVPLTDTGSGIPFVAMQEDKKGRLWTYTANNALYKRENKDARFDLFKSNVLGDYGVSLLHSDSKGRLWAVVGGNRLMQYREEKNDFINVAIPLSSDCLISFIENGKNGNLWIGTKEKVISFDPETGTSDRTITSDGNLHAVHDSSSSLSDSTILFGTYDGLCRLSPEIKSPHDDEIKVFMLYLSFPYLEDSAAELKRLGLDRLLYTLDEIRLPYSDNTFTIHLAATADNETSRVRYQYKLEGVDKTWMSASGNEVTFTDLSPGTYHLMLRAESGSDAQISYLTIKILPPWYLSWPAFIVYLLVIAALIWLSIRIMRRKMRQKTEEKIHEMQIMKERETYESKMRFFVNLVHEIRTPLTLISLPLEQLAESRKEGNRSIEEDRGLVKSMQKNLDYLLGIINQLLDFRKAEQDSEVRLHLTANDLTKLLRNICNRFEDPLSTKGKALVVNTPDEEITAYVDVDKLDRVIMNIMGNAMKYCHDKVTVSLKKEEDGNVIILISDDGPGIPESEREHIFDTYYQIAGDETGASLGTGLGLAYARLIARAHGGDITVNDNTGGGASFRLVIPTANSIEKVADHESADESTPGDLIETASAKGKLNILFAEDNEELRETVAEALGHNHNVIAVKDGAEAMKVLTENDTVDIIISDYMMPEIDGAELCRRVKGDINTSYIPFIMLTAKTGRDAKEETMDAGADAFIEKPFSIKQLNAQIANIIHTRRLFFEKMSGPGKPSNKISEEVPYLNKVDAEFLQSLNENIMENIYDEDFSIDTMADKKNMSRSTFYRRMKAITGMTPVDYLKNFRLEHAARLLDEGMRVTEVSDAVGFTSSSYFAKCFKAKYGMIPKEYASRKR